mmetsp:Transcript_22856/g.65902  ORF Transcript_22856/g.65902 Transcript_22856/m.65902 type:complete len:205 (+) Transcript_22856:790-1404(+)
MQSISPASSPKTMPPLLRFGRLSMSLQMSTLAFTLSDREHLLRQNRRRMVLFSSAARGAWPRAVSPSRRPSSSSSRSKRRLWPPSRLNSPGPSQSMSSSLDRSGEILVRPWMLTLDWLSPLMQERVVSEVSCSCLPTTALPTLARPPPLISASSSPTNCSASRKPEAPVDTLEPPPSWIQEACSMEPSQSTTPVPAMTPLTAWV